MHRVFVVGAYVGGGGRGQRSAGGVIEEGR